MVCVSSALLGNHTCQFEKCLKIPKGQSESVNRMTDNTMGKRKRTEGKAKYGGYWIDKIANDFKDK